MRSCIFILCVGCLALFAACSKPTPDRYAQSPQFGTCINGLRHIDGAKQQWALEHKLTTNALPTMADLLPYLTRNASDDLGWFRCPSGGTYTIGRVADAPTCSF